MKAIAVGSTAAALIGFALGFATPLADEVRAPQNEAEPPTTQSQTDPPVESGPAIPRPGFDVALAAAERPEQFRDLIITLWDEEPDSPERDEWLRTVIARWVDVGGPEVIRTMGSQPFWLGSKAYGKIAASRDFAVHHLALTDLDAAIEASRRIRSGGAASLSQLVLGRYPGRLPEFLENGMFAGRHGDWTHAGRLLANQSADGAGLLESTLRQNRAASRNYLGALFAGYAEGLAASDPEAMLAWADQLKEIESEIKFNSTSGTFAPSEVVEIAAAQQLLETDLARATELAESGSSQFLALVGKRLAHDDIWAAAKWMEQHNDGRLRGFSLWEVFEQSVSQLPPEEALPFFADHPVGSATRFVSSRDPDEAPTIVELAAATPSLSDRDKILGAALQTWSRSEPDQAARTARELIEQGESPAIAISLAESIAQHPGQLFDLVAMLPEEDREKFATRLSRQAGFADPEPVASAISDQLDNPLSPELAAAFAGEWSKDGLRGPSRWLASLPDGPVRDAGAAALVEQLAPYDADAALQWAESIGDAAVRDALLEQLTP